MSVRQLTIKYVAQRQARGEIGERTAEQFRSRLYSFSEIAPKDPMQVNRRHVERWMETPGLSPGTRRGRLSALRGFVEWCMLNRYMKTDPTLGIRSPKVPPGLPRALRHDDAASIIRSCRDVRTRVAALLMLQEGLRRAEVAGVLVADICLRANTVAVRGKGGQGSVTRVTPLSDETVRTIKQYLAVVGMTSGPLIRSVKHPDRGLSPAHVGALVTAVMSECGVKVAAGDGVSPHALRHTTAHEMIDRGADVLEVKEMLGHASINNTMIYLRGHVSADLRQAAAGRAYLTG
jgi:integrase/recombinase XerC